MRNLKRVVWSKGMFLSPQHFQTQDDYFEDTLQFRLTGSTNHNWGLTDIAIDQESLSNGQFRLRHARGVFPEGLAFHIPDTDDPPSGREIAEFFPPTQAELEVFLALPERRLRGRNVSLLPAEAPTRYLAETRSAVDQATGVEEKPVQVCARNFRIVFGGESLDGLSVLRIAKIMRSATGAYIPHPDFIAPALSLAAGEQLLVILRRLIEVLAGKAVSLAAQRRQKGRAQADFVSADLGSFWLLHTINTHLPVLKHAWAQRRQHPEALYVQLLSLAGALTTFTLGDDAGNLPDYQHSDPGACFAALDVKIRDLLETAIPSKCVVIPLTLQEKSTWNGGIPDPQLFQQTQFVLSVGARMGIDDLIKQVPKLVKASPPPELGRLIRNALPGITLRHLPVPPIGVPVKLDRQYFALNQSGVLWEGLTRAQQISIFVPDEVASPELELLIVLA